MPRTFNLTLDDMAKRLRYSYLSQSDRLQFHLVRFFCALWQGDYFEAYRQSCIGANIAKQLN